MNATLYKYTKRCTVVAAVAAINIRCITFPVSRFVHVNALEMPTTQYLSRQDGSKLAYIYSDGTNCNNESGSHNIERKPGLMFFPGFLSKMHSSKGMMVYRFCEENNLDCTLFDRYGHGSSRPHYTSDEYNGAKATITRWVQDGVDILDTLDNNKKQILVGSSMGCWLAILTALQRPDRVAAIVGIASAPDYTKLLREHINSNDSWANDFNQKGHVDIPTVYDRRGYYRIHNELLDDGDKHLLLEGSLNSIALPKNTPIRLLHGLADKDIPYQYSEQLVRVLEENNFVNVRLDLIENGDHRLSSSNHLSKLQGILNEVLGHVTV